MPSMMTPLSVQFTLEQRDWLDARTRGGVLSRSSVIRLIVGRGHGTRPARQQAR